MLERSHPRIFFDANGDVGPEEIILSFNGSLRDIAVLGDQLREGVTVTLYDDGDEPDEIEIDAILRRDLESGHWIGLPISGLRCVSRS